MPTDPTTPLSPEEVAELRELLAKATPGPWRQCGAARGGCQCCMVWTQDSGSAYVAQAISNDPEAPSPDLETAKANAALIAESRNALPRLLAAVEENAHYRGAIRSAFDAAGIRVGDDLYLSDAIARLVAHARSREQGELEALAELDELRARVTELEEALRPFADAADGYKFALKHYPAVTGDVLPPLKLSALGRARALIEKGK